MPDIERLVDELIQQVDGCECCREEREPRVSAARAAILAEFARWKALAGEACATTHVYRQAIINRVPLSEADEEASAIRAALTSGEQP